MKRFVTFVFLFFTFLGQLFNQPIYELVDTTKSWNTMSMGFITWGVAVCGGTETNKFFNSEFFNGHMYRKVYEKSDSTQTDWNEVGLIREDTLSKRIYYSNGYDPEGLLYDFNITVGDTVHVENSYCQFSSYLICSSIDTVIVAGEPKRKFYFQAYYPNRDTVDETWIEGVGSLYGVLNSGLGASGICGGTNVLLCCRQNGTIIYHNTVYNSCYIETFYPQIIQDSFDTAYLDIPYMFQVEVDTGNAVSFNFTGDVIPDDFYFNPATGLLFGTPTQTGTLTCVIRVKNNQLNLFTDIIYGDLVVESPEYKKEQPEAAKMKVFPNPFHKFATIQLPENCEASILKVVNVDGKMILQKSLSDTFNRFDFTLLPTGIYYFKFYNRSGNQVSIIPTIKK